MSRHGAGTLLRTLRFAPADSTLAAGWTPVLVRELLRLARAEGAVLWLARRLGDLGVLADPELAAIVRPVAYRELPRGMRVDEQTEAVVESFTAREIPFVLLKGPARRALTAHYPYADARSTTDVDILVPEGRARAAWEGLREQGYEEAYPPGTLPPNVVHLPPIWDHRRVAVEIHVTTSPWVTPEEAWRRATTDSTGVTWRGRQLDLPGATELIWHGLAHAYSHEPAEVYRLRAFLDVAAILAVRPRVDWETIAARLAGGELHEIQWRVSPRPLDPALARQWLGAAAWLAGVSLPAAVAPATPLALERLVRWRGVVGRLPAERLRERVLAEGVRCEVGLEPTRIMDGSTPTQRIRRVVVTRLSRLAYRGWRLIGGSRAATSVAAVGLL